MGGVLCQFLCILSSCDRAGGSWWQNKRQACFSGKWQKRGSYCEWSRTMRRQAIIVEAQMTSLDARWHRKTTLLMPALWAIWEIRPFRRWASIVPNANTGRRSFHLWMKRKCPAVRWVFHVSQSWNPQRTTTRRRRGGVSGEDRGDFSAHTARCRRVPGGRKTLPHPFLILIGQSASVCRELTPDASQPINRYWRRIHLWWTPLTATKPSKIVYLKELWKVAFLYLLEVSHKTALWDICDRISAQLHPFCQLVVPEGRRTPCNWIIIMRNSSWILFCVFIW